MLRDEYGMNAANRPQIKVNPAEVPLWLHPLIPLVERWAIPCDVTRGDYFDHQPAEDIAGFWYEVLPQVESINAWLDSQPRNVGAWPAAAVHFMYFLKAHSEAWQPTEEEQKILNEREAAWEREQALKQAIATGLQAFNERNYAAVVEALQPFEQELDRVTQAKLTHARRKIMG